MYWRRISLLFCIIVQNRKILLSSTNSVLQEKVHGASGNKTLHLAQKHKRDDCLPEIFLELLKPTFISLSDSKLLQRCVRGTTQNPTECINSLVWVRCPKHKHHRPKVVRCAAASAICHFHKRGRKQKENHGETFYTCWLTYLQIHPQQGQSTTSKSW